MYNIPIYAGGLLVTTSLITSIRVKLLPEGSFPGEQIDRGERVVLKSAPLYAESVPHPRLSSFIILISNSGMSLLDDRTALSYASEQIDRGDSVYT